MSLILCIETAEKTCSVALFNSGQLLGFEEIEENNAHSKFLFPLIETLLNAHHISLQDLAAVAISGGPGSYTGLRIGCSAAKGICYALNKPMIAMGSLEIMASGYMQSNSLNKEDRICVMMDARRMEVFWQFFDARGSHQTTAVAAILTDESYQNSSIDGRHHVLGTAVLKARPLDLFSDAVYVEKSYLHAKFMGVLALEKLKNKEFEDVAYYEPEYVKDFFFGPKK